MDVWQPEIPAEKLSEISRYVMVETSIEQADLAFVFGTRHGADTFVDTTAEYWRAGFFPQIFIAGGPTMGISVPEADILRTGLIERGVDPARIHCERQSLNTGDNVRLALPLIERVIGLRKIRAIVGVGKISSARRYLMTLQRHWPEPKKMLLPVNYFGVSPEKWMDDNDFRKRVIGEWEKIPHYIREGYLTEVDSSSIRPIVKA